MSGSTPTDLLWAQEGVLSPEIRACLACARAVVDPDRIAGFWAALAACSDPDLLCAAAVGQGMLGHLHRMAAGQEAPSVDAAVAGRLAEVQRQSAHRSLRQTAYLLRVLESLRAAGVATMPFKGPAWAEWLYGDVTIRSWVDLDILVPRDQAALAREVLVAEGFAEGRRFGGRILSQKRRGWGEIVMSNAKQGVHADLHWEITVGFSGRALEAESLFSRGRRLPLLGKEVAAPSAVDMLLISCLHGTRHRWNRVEELLGLAVQVKGTAPADWSALMAEAEAAGCRRRVAVGVSHAGRVFGLDLPAEVTGSIARDRVAGALLRSLGPDTLDRDASSRSRRELVVLGWVFATEDSVPAALWHGAVRFFRPGPEDWEAYALPPWADWLYYVLRPPRLALKWLRRLF